jgi:hypothetical protein
MHVSDEKLQEFKEIWKKEYDEDLTDDQAREYGENMVRVFETLFHIDQRVQRWNKRLETEPNGFALPDSESYNCCVCYARTSDNGGWYDQYGIKCGTCQTALEEGSYPPLVCTDRDSWYSMSDLKRKFQLERPTITKKIRSGELKTRTIKLGGRSYHYIFLKSENNFPE